MELIEKYFWILATFLVPVLYIVVAGIFYLIFHIFRHDDYRESKIQPEPVTDTQIKREVFYGIVSLGIFSITGFTVFLLHKNGYSMLYFQPLKYGFTYLFISVLLMILFHDMYFYWTHRLLHLNGWYQKVHSVHHLSSNPSPFTALSFHPVEGFIQAAVLPIMVVIIPSHPFALFLFLCFMVYKNVCGHAGYEFTNAAYRGRKWNALRSYSIHHNLHHLHSRDNYGLYFTIWDKMMQTFRTGDDPRET